MNLRRKTKKCSNLLYNLNEIKFHCKIVTIFFSILYSQITYISDKTIDAINKIVNDSKIEIKGKVAENFHQDLSERCFGTFDNLWDSLEMDKSAVELKALKLKYANNNKQWFGSFSSFCFSDIVHKFVHF